MTLGLLFSFSQSTFVNRHSPRTMGCRNARLPSRLLCGMTVNKKEFPSYNNSP